MRARLLAALIATAALSAVATGSPQSTAEAVRDRLFPGAQIEWARATASPQLVAFRLQGNQSIFYVTADGKLMLPGADALVDVAGGVDLQLRDRAEDARAALAALPDGHRLRFPAPDERHRLTVFTDVDCGYCRKLHEHIDEFLAAGITIDYVLVARGGPASPTATTHTSIWCAQDRQSMLTLAKRGEPVPAATGCPTPFEAAEAAAVAAGMRGTPHVVSAEGYVLGGYLDASTALTRLETLNKLVAAHKDGTP